MVWTGAENVALAGIRSLDLTTHFHLVPKDGYTYTSALPICLHGVRAQELSNKITMMRTKRTVLELMELCILQWKERQTNERNDKNLSSATTLQNASTALVEEYLHSSSTSWVWTFSAKQVHLHKHINIHLQWYTHLLWVSPSFWTSRKRTHYTKKHALVTHSQT
jgi:hypothetical protein